MIIDRELKYDCMYNEVKVNFKKTKGGLATP